MNLKDMAQEAERLKVRDGQIINFPIMADVFTLVTALADSNLLPLLVDFSAASTEYKRCVDNYNLLQPIIESINKSQEDKVLIRIRQLELTNATSQYEKTSLALLLKLKELS